MIRTEASTPRNAALRRLARVRERIRAVPGGRATWRAVVTVVGVVITLAGIVLLAIPGPGWLIVFAGLGVLGSEYAWAQRLLRWVRAQVRAWWRWLADQPLWVRVLFSGLGLLLLAALALVVALLVFG